MRRIVSAVLLAGVAVSVTAQPSSDSSTPTVPLYDGMGSHHHAITTDSPLAQKYFDQGLTLAWGFNHAEAERSFRQAAALDPKCAMCWWGVALVQGPNINLPMQPEANAVAWEALQNAERLAPGVSARERAYIRALSARYVADPPEDRSSLDKAYADAMRELVHADLDDEDATVLFAEALMDTTPWDYWQKDGEPKPVTREILGGLDSILARDPTHVGANHLYIHTVEAVHPTWGIVVASRLGSLVPGAGHLVHMPAHIWIRVGRYHDALLANERGIEADEHFLAQCNCHPEGIYAIGYMPHNHHFLWEVAMMVGNRGISLREANYLQQHLDPQMMRMKDLTVLQQFWVPPLFTQVAFGMWNDVLAAPAPGADLAYPTAVWHFARSIAFTRQGELQNADDELSALTKVAADPALEQANMGTTAASNLAAIAVHVAEGELSAASGDFDHAVDVLREAAAEEDALTYDEPPDWPLPVRRNLGAVLLEAGRPAEAETIFRQDLARFPDNPRSLFGLAESLDAQGKSDEAAATRRRLEAASGDADEPVTAARL